MKITIINWEKYNPRTDIKHTTWFRVQNSFWSDHVIFRLSNDGKMVWFTLLALASQRMNGEIEVDFGFIAAVLTIPVSIVSSAIDDLQSGGIIKIPTSRGRNANVTHTSRARDAHVSPTTDRQTGQTDRQTVNSADSDIPRSTRARKRMGALDAENHSVAIATGPAGSDIWQAYRTAYVERYKVEPVRNARANSLCKKLVERLGGEAAIGVVRFFLTHGKSFYVAKAHDLSLCIADAEGLHTQMIAGHRITTSAAAEADRNSGNQQVFENVAKRMEARRAARELENADK